MSLVFLILICAFVASLLYVVNTICFQYSYWKKRKVPHLPLIPILGHNAPLLFRSVSFPIHIQNLYKEFPNARYFGLFDFKKPTVLIKDPELIRDICIRNFDSFMDHENFVTEEMDPFVGRNLFSLTGQRWKNVRNTLTPSFTAARMKLMFELIAECSRDFVQYFTDHPEVAQEFEAKDAFTRYTNDVIGTAAFGVKVDSMKNRDNEFYLNAKAAVAFTSSQIVKFELMHRFPRLMHHLGATFLSKSADRFLKNLITDTVNVRRERGIIRQDMIHLLMLAMDKQDGVEITVDDIIGQAFFFLLAGFETSSSFVCFLCHELAANPEIQARVRQEIDEQVEKDNGKINYESLGKMKYLDMVVSETLRKYPAIPFTNRVCTKDIKFPAPADGYPECHIEKGTVLIVPFYGFHKDPKYFARPEEFDPERFSEENKGNIDPYIYTPFGIGPRQCIGNRFALMETKIVIVDVLRKFVVKFTEKSVHPVKYDKTTFTMTSVDGFWLKFEERKKVD